MTTEQFIAEIAEYVKQYAPLYNIQVYSPIIAQAILESGRGTSELAIKANNFFGLKYKNGRCPSACGIYYKVGSEQNPDGSYTSSAMKWCKFADMEDCVKGYFDFINTRRYANLKGITDPETYLKKIKADGYATSLKYVSNLMKVIDSYNLTKYDVPKDKKYYRVQVGAFSKKKYAENLLNDIKKEGFSPILKKYGNLYKVQIGAFSNRSNAENMKEIIRDKGFNAFVTYC